MIRTFRVSFHDVAWDLRGRRVEDVTEDLHVMLLPGNAKVGPHVVIRIDAVDGRTLLAEFALTALCNVTRELARVARQLYPREYYEPASPEGLN